MILVDISDLELKAYAQQLSYMTYDFNMDHDTDIKPIAKSEAHFNKWIVNYPFYSNIHKEGVVLYGAASVSYTHLDVYKRQPVLIVKRWQIFMVRAASSMSKSRHSGK